MKKRILIIMIAAGFTASLTNAQDTNGWHLKDKEKGGYQGISLDKAYEFLKAKNKKSTKVIVAVIDSGIDTTHEDLKPILWTNTKEVAGNGVDDDKNGYVDDIHGWNYLGGANNTSVKQDSYEGARVYHGFKSKYKGKEIDKTKLSKADLYEYEMWKKSEKFIIGSNSDEEGPAMDPIILKRMLTSMVKADSLLQTTIGKPVFTGTELNDFIPATDEAKKAKNGLLSLMKGNDQLTSTNKEFMEGMTGYVNGEISKEEAKTTAPTNYRKDITGDEESDWNARGYGNNDIMSSTPLHGTHVSGIIAAIRGNGKGMDGVADNVEIMTLRAVPDGDEHDKDIALAIRYAADNGAKVINMSFGKSFSPYKQWIDEAVQYAQQKGVLLVHAAGNDNKNLDNKEVDNFPCAEYLATGKQASNWITVGASGDAKINGIAASFSNYGKKKVDVFAPGVKIYATIPGGNTYGNLQGTSMASPVVAGVAALIKSYYPNLTPEQVKKAIESTTSKASIKAKKPGTNDDINFSELSRTGGVINAFGAIKAADQMSNGKIPAPQPKSKVVIKKKA
jgi:cell wall-associated protease